MSLINNLCYSQLFDYLLHYWLTSLQSVAELKEILHEQTHFVLSLILTKRLMHALAILGRLAH